MTNEEVMTLMFDMGIHESLDKEDWIPDNAWFWFANKVAERERDACRLIVLDNSDAEGICCTDDVLEALRQRGEK